MASVFPGGWEASEGTKSGEGRMDTKGHGEGSCLGKRERICSQPAGPVEPEVGILGLWDPRMEEQQGLGPGLEVGVWQRQGTLKGGELSHEAGLGGCEWMSSHMWVGKYCYVLQGSEIKILRKTSEVKASCILEVYI